MASQVVALGSLGCRSLLPRLEVIRTPPAHQGALHKSLPLGEVFPDLSTGAELSRPFMAHEPHHAALSLTGFMSVVPLCPWSLRPSRPAAGPPLDPGDGGRRPQWERSPSQYVPASALSLYIHLLGHLSAGAAGHGTWNRDPIKRDLWVFFFVIENSVTMLVTGKSGHTCCIDFSR